MWTINSYIRDDRGEQMGLFYKDASVELKIGKKPGKKGKITFRFFLNDSTIDARTEGYREENPDLKIDKYVIIYTGMWDIYKKDPKLIRITVDDNMSVDITGPGKDAEEFKNGEEGKLFGLKAAGSKGGIAGFIVKKSVESASGINDINADIPYQGDFVINGNKMEIKGAKNLNFKLTKK